MTEPATTRRLDLGAGAVTRVPEALRADRSFAVRPDVVLDATTPLPFRTNSFSAVYCFDLVEHIEVLTSLMTEIHRVLAPGGTVLITTPHFSCANSYTDPTHRHHLGYRSFDYFTDDHALRYYSEARFEISRRILHFHGGLVDAIVRRMAARWPHFYEHRLAWLVPAFYLEFEHTAVT
ncbi:MAG: class I SAM-dependent methyltransferase [Gemmatimonadetes bacterium]|nr:class I SAM-dependent methyltransferase [Gemmatimonadota bacterium]